MNPYEVLGVSENASMEEVKKAYKKLVKKYHPDRYVNNPLQDLADEKLREINWAYDEITENFDKRDSYENDYYDDESDFSDVRKYIKRRNFETAMAILNASSNRNAEWHFLTGVIYMNQGWHDQAYSYIERAVAMEPNNAEYKNAFRQLKRMEHQYKQNAYNRGGYRKGCMICDICDACTCLCCADSLCESAGGDLIDCC